MVLEPHDELLLMGAMVNQLDDKYHSIHEMVGPHVDKYLSFGEMVSHPLPFLVVAEKDAVVAQPRIGVFPLLAQLSFVVVVDFLCDEELLTCLAQ